ncbi:MAG: protease complex subunit PrcB family protein [Candidatus Syntrophonatronum acetioxidans]|uniref:Protease complex subunit PrcB family protein n=1 Tax=Candidatus Syntrophonatronum acetioxidans TaxID=1795816 RepID=A0A424YCN5_9FIRM|nr:MAG: protease complex subunit PrcB family protein [Candidatus Syntrophonatronum acetioxidans]
MNPRTRRCIVLLFLAFLMGFTGCVNPFDKIHSGEIKNMIQMDFYRPPEEELPEEIKEWVNRSLTINMGQSQIYDEKLYILVTYGERPTGGYKVRVTDIVLKDDVLKVKVYFKAPEEGDLVTQAITYPYDLVVVEDPPSLPVEFKVSGDEDCLMNLRGIDKLEPITAESACIKVFEPSPNERVGRKFEIRGIASNSEGNIVYEIFYEEDYYYRGYFSTGEEGWNYFSIPVKVPEEISGKFRLELYSSIIEGNKLNLVTLSLNLEEEDK